MTISTVPSILASYPCFRSLLYLNSVASLSAVPVLYSSLSVNTNLSGARAKVKMSFEFSKRSVPSSSGANLTSNRETIRAVTLRSSISANCLPTQPNGPKHIGLVIDLERFMGERPYRSRTVKILICLSPCLVAIPNALEQSL
jgi:hypothetical protein